MYSHLIPSNFNALLLIKPLVNCLESSSSKHDVKLPNHTVLNTYGSVAHKLLACCPLHLPDCIFQMDHVQQQADYLVLLNRQDDCPCCGLMLLLLQN